MFMTLMILKIKNTNPRIIGLVEQMQTQIVSSPHAPNLRVIGVSAGRLWGGKLLWDPLCADGAAGGNALE